MATYKHVILEQELRQIGGQTSEENLADRTGLSVEEIREEIHQAEKEGDHTISNGGGYGVVLRR